MNNIKGKYIKPIQTFNNSTTTKHIENSTQFINSIQSPTIRKITLKPSKNEKPVVALDVSSIRIGETKTGELLAIRGAIVWKEKKRYKYQRIGPIPFHLTEQNKKEIYKFFKKNRFEFSQNPNIINIQTKMGNLLERWLQLVISSSVYETLILWDGSMTAGMIDSPVEEINHLLETARNRLSTILAFSKNTNLRLSCYKITDYAKKSNPPCLLYINNFPASAGPPCFLGDIYIAKLTKGVCSFRLDIDKKIPSYQRIEAVESLLGSDLVVESYPESLRLAHIYSTFTAIEVIGIQRFIAKKYGLKILIRPNVRRLLFGPFGKGLEA
jgi:hypothetical protein